MPQFATFTLADRLFGLNVQLVQEVMHDQTLTPVPLAPETVLGLINLRGQILVAVDLAKLLRLPSRVGQRLPPAEPHPAEPHPARLHLAEEVLILQTADDPISLVVDDLGDVVETTEADYEACSGLLDDELDELVLGVYRLDEGLLHVLDAAELVQRLQPPSKGR